MINGVFQFVPEAELSGTKFGNIRVETAMVRVTIAKDQLGVGICKYLWRQKVALQ